MKDSIYCTMTEEKFELKQGTKTVYSLLETKTKEISQEQYNNIINSSPFFRRLGGSETATKGYTEKGYNVIRLVSKSPCRELKTIRTFDFNTK